MLLATILTILLLVFIFYLLSSVEDQRSQIVDQNHFCKRSLDLEVQVNALSEKLNRCKMLCKEKAIEIKRLNSMVRYYQKRSDSLKDIINNMKSQDLISDEAEEALNVRKIA